MRLPVALLRQSLAVWRRVLAAGVALGGAFFLACNRGDPGPVPGSALSLLYSGNVDGEIEPCG